MSFTKHYLKKHRLDTLPPKHQKNLEKLEKKLQEKAQGNSDFEECLKKYGPQLADLIERTSNALDDIEFNDFWDAVTKLRVIISVGIEVYQLVDLMSDYVINDDMTEEEKEETRLEFGKELIYFVWMTIDPLKDYLSWLPFRKSFERFVIMLLAEYALKAALNLFDANDVISVMGFDSSKQIVRALP